VLRLTRRCATRGGVSIAAFAALLVLSGCQWLPSFGSRASAPAEACPAALILRPLANTAVFGSGSKRTPENVAFYGILSDVSLNCEKTGDTLRTKLDVVVIAQRGPAARSNDVELHYFVAVVGPQQAILSKRPFAVHIDVTHGRRAGVTDHIEEAIPLAGRKPNDLSIDLGFQQGPDVVEFYKHFRGR
jgi:hypothetical protein